MNACIGYKSRIYLFLSLLLFMSACNRADPYKATVSTKLTEPVAIGDDQIRVTITDVKNLGDSLGSYSAMESNSKDIPSDLAGNHDFARLRLTVENQTDKHLLFGGFLVKALVGGKEQGFWAVCSLAMLVGNTLVNQEPKGGDDWLCSTSGWAVLKAKTKSDVQLIYILPSDAQKFDIKLVSEDLTKYDIGLPDE